MELGMGTLLSWRMNNVRYHGTLSLQVKRKYAPGGAFLLSFKKRVYVCV